MKRNLFKLLALLCAGSMMLSLAGCSSEETVGSPPAQPSEQKENPLAIPPKGEQNKATTETAAPQESPAASAEPEEDESLNVVYGLLDELEYDCAVAYLGYTEGPLGDGYVGLFEENGALEHFPFLANIPSERIIEQEGGEVYCIIPRNERAFISVYAQDFDYEGNIYNDEELFRSMDSGPFLIRGNISEILANTLVNIQYEDGSSIEFSPYLSGEDGQLGISEEQLILDISVYEDFIYGSEASGEWQYLSEEELEGQWVAFDVCYDESTQLTCYLEFGKDENGANRVLYWYGYADGDIIELFEGSYYQGDIIEDEPFIMMEMELSGGSAMEDIEPYSWAGCLQFGYSFYGDVIEVTHLEGDPLVSGFEGESIIFERCYG